MEPVAIGVDARGRALVLARRSADDGTTSAVLVRLTPTGALDRTYDRDGVVAIPVGRGSEVEFGILAVAGDGAATIVGHGVEPSTPGGSGITYLRLTPAGAAPDARFGTRGRVEPTVPGAVAFSPSGIALEPAGGIAVLGTAFISPTERSAAAMRLRADGSLDPAFGGAVPLRLLPALGSTSSGGGQLVRSADGGLTGTGVACTSSRRRRACSSCGSRATARRSRPSARAA